MSSPPLTKEPNKPILLTLYLSKISFLVLNVLIIYVGDDSLPSIVPGGRR